MRWTKRWLRMHPEYSSLWDLVAAKGRWTPIMPEVNGLSDIHLTICRRARWGRQALAADLKRFKELRRFGERHPNLPDVPEGTLDIVRGKIVVTGVDL